MPVDLHVHTTASDGKNSPAEVVARAAGLGLEALAITDHDTLGGIGPAVQAGQARGIEIVPGIELSTEADGVEIHILGYLMELDHQELTRQIALFRRNRFERIEKMVVKLQELGFRVEMEKVLALAGTGSVGRPHLAAAMVEAGIVNDLKEAFRQYIGAGCPAYVPRYKVTPEAAIQLIRQAKGLPVLAHPGLSDAGALVPHLVQNGLLGLEAYHPAHTWQLSEYYCRLAQEHKLVITGGSDYHGSGYKEGHDLGAATVPYATLQEMKKIRASVFF